VSFVEFESFAARLYAREARELGTTVADVQPSPNDIERFLKDEASLPRMPAAD